MKDIKKGEARRLKIMGLHAVMRRTEMGHLCGYIEIPKGHPYYNKDYDANGEWQTVMTDGHGGRYQIKFPAIEVHGGVTYAGDLSEKKGKFFWGFDCAHYGDTPETCDEEYVLQELACMARQVLQIGEEYALAKAK